MGGAQQRNGGDQVQSGLGRVDHRLEVGVSVDLEHTTYRVAAVAWAVMSLLILAGLFGVFGEGWLAHTQSGAPGVPLRADYDRIIRLQKPEQLTLHIAPQAIEDGAVSVRLSSAFIDDMQLQSIVPRPSRWQPAGGGDILLVYDHLGGEAGRSGLEVTIGVKSSSIGLVRAHAEIPGHPPIRLNSIVLP